MYQRVGAAAYKADLRATRNLAAYLDNPEKNLKTIHVGGTNGKGSTSHMLASILSEAGYKTGLYTSPHLKDFRERIRINGKPVSKKYVTGFVKKHKEYFEENQLSFFEMTVGLALDYFREKKVDIAVMEVGMGGRLDSTNIISPEVSVITNIGRDHTAFLGNSPAEIAAEKAGIIKKGIPVVIGEILPETREVFEETARRMESELIVAETVNLPNYSSDLKGIYQEKNIRTALAAAGVLQKKGWKIEEKHLRDGLARTIKNTGLQGRWQELGQNPKIICDTGHNREALLLVMDQLSRQSFDKLHIVLGVVSDKDLASILPLFPGEAVYYFARPDVPRGISATELAGAAKEYGLNGKPFPDVAGALKAAREAAGKNDLIFVGGSTFVVAEVI